MPDPRALSSDELLSLVVGARWFAAKDRTPESAAIVGLPVEDGQVNLAIVEVRFATGTHEHYLVALGEGDEVVDAFERPEVAGRLASLAGVPAEGARVRPLGVEQSNSSVVLDELHMLKLYRHLEAGPNPELELLAALAAQGFPNVPRLEGALETTDPPVEAALASVTAFVPSAGGGWELTLASFGDDPSWLPERAWRLGEVTAGLHSALAANDSDPHLMPEEPSNESLGRDRRGDRDDVRNPPGGRRARRGRASRGGPARPRAGAHRGGIDRARDPHPRRLPPRPGALVERRRLGGDRLRGRARAAADRAPAQAVAVA
jgi:maltokinase